MRTNETLQKSRAKLGDAPRDFSNDRTYLEVDKPQWLINSPDDKLHLHFNHLNQVFRSGDVIWGHIIQVNQILFNEGNDNHPGEIVYSLDNPENVDPNELQNVANKLYSLKGTKPSDPALEPLADYLTNEYIRVFGLPVPSTISPRMNCFISTTIFVRKHLPEGKVKCPLFPIIINHESPYVISTLPEKFWPEDFREQWIQYGSPEEVEDMEQVNTPKIINEFGKRKKKQLLVTVPLILAIIGMVAVEDMDGSVGGIPVPIISTICITLVFAGIIFSFFNWRCPSCKTYLGRGFSPKFCRKCGVQLQ